MHLFCYRYSKSKTGAEELFHQAFIKVFQSLHQLKSIETFEAWLRKIIINTSLNRYRQKFHISYVRSLTDSNLDQLYLGDFFSRSDTKDLFKMIKQLPQSLPINF